MRRRLRLIPRLTSRVSRSVFGERCGETIGTPPEQRPVARRLASGLIDQDTHADFAPACDRGADARAERRGEEHDRGD